MRTIIYLTGVLGLAGLSLFLLGFCLPNEFSGEVSKQFNCSANKLWELITTPEAHHKINSEIASINILNDNTWEEVDKLGSITKFEVLESVENKKLVVKVVNDGMNVEKTRVYQIFENEETCYLTVKQTCYVDRILLKSTLAISGSKQDIKKEVNELYDEVNS